MPIYEMPLLIKLGQKVEYANILKNVANSIFRAGGFIRKIENWGEKELPCKSSAHGTVHKKAGHFFFIFNAPPAEISNILDECQRNLSIVRTRIYIQNESHKQVECTFEEEQLPPPYRPEVQEMLKHGKKKTNKKEFKYNSGLDYYPFLR